MSKDEATKEILRQVYEKELMSGEKMNDDLWQEMCEHDDWLKVSLKAMEDFYQSKLNKVTNDNQISDLIYNENSPDLTEFECEKLQDIIIEHLKKN